MRPDAHRRIVSVHRVEAYVAFGSSDTLAAMILLLYVPPNLATSSIVFNDYPLTTSNEKC